MPTKKTEEKGNKNKTSPENKDKESSKDTQMRTAFIRVAKNNYTGEDKKTLVTYSEDQIKETLEFWAWESGLTYWFIEHNPDDDLPNPHYHIVIKFKTHSRFTTVKSKFPYGDIEQAKNIRNSVQYLIHLNDLSKVQYNWEDVVTNCGDMSPFKVQSRAQQAVAMQSIYDMIESGELTELNIREKVSMSVFSENKSKILNAFEHKRGEYFENQNRNISVVFISGNTGQGKTTFAKQYCERRGLTYCVSSASNDPVQDYRGQEVLILDDMRDDSFKYHDLLKLLDNHTKSTAHSRYYNKVFTGSLIIITSTRPINDWYFKKTAEDKHQLYRRVKQWYKFDKEKIFLFEYNEQTFRYDPICSAPKPAWSVPRNTENKTIDMFADMGLEKSYLTKPELASLLYAPIPEATEEEKENRRLYEASLPPINQENLNKYRIG